MNWYDFTIKKWVLTWWNNRTREMHGLFWRGPFGKWVLFLVQYFFVMCEVNLYDFGWNLWVKFMSSHLPKRVNHLTPKKIGKCWRIYHFHTASIGRRQAPASIYQIVSRTTCFLTKFQEKRAPPTINIQYLVRFCKLFFAKCPRESFWSYTVSVSFETNHSSTNRQSHTGW